MMKIRLCGIVRDKCHCKNGKFLYQIVSARPRTSEKEFSFYADISFYDDIVIDTYTVISAEEAKIGNIVSVSGKFTKRKDLFKKHYHCPVCGYKQRETIDLLVLDGILQVRNDTTDYRKNLQILIDKAKMGKWNNKAEIDVELNQMTETPEVVYFDSSLFPYRMAYKYPFFKESRSKFTQQVQRKYCGKAHIAMQDSTEASYFCSNCGYYSKTDGTEPVFWLNHMPE